VFFSTKGGYEEQFQEALKTVRELDRFSESHPINFVYPTIQQMLAMSRDRPLQIDKLRWQVDKYNPKYIVSIGISLTNGSKSPMFTGKKQELLSEIKEIDISNQTKTIFLKKYPGYCNIQNLDFRNKEG
jgi:hypothetical protein